jgi:cellulose synthase/poly-beta-1,6-N-acetylglucosamine synthase-like glycosyltransferase
MISLGLALLFVVSVLAVAYPIAIYPLLVGLVAAVRPRPWKTGEVELKVAHLITVFNEERRIGPKLDNAVEVTPPPGGLATYVVSDGSDDGTEEIVRGYADRGVRWIGCSRQGKERVQMEAIRAIDADILVFSDASSLLERESLARLIRPFADPEVAAVSGTDRLEGAEQGTGEDLYVRFEMGLRRAESRAGSLVGLSGCYFAARREVVERWVPDVPNDMGSALVAIAMGRRAVAVDEARCTYGATTSATREFRRKKRTALRGLRGLIAYRSALTRGGPIKGWQVFSHKVMRFLAPFFTLTALATLVAGSLAGLAWARIGLIVAAVTILIGVAGMIAPSRLGPLRAVSFIALSMAAVGAAWLSVFKRDSAALWTPTERP